MDNHENLLQERLAALEGGVRLDKTLEIDDDETKELIKLAASIRGLQQPEFDPNPARTRFVQTLKTAKTNKRPMNKPVTLPDENKNIFNPKNLLWALIPTTAGAALVALLAFLTFFSLATWLSGSRGAQSATIDTIQGRVQIASSEDPDAWSDAVVGQKLQAGDKVRTLDASLLTFSFYNGSKVSLGANADIMLVRVDGERGGVLRAAFIQNSGRSSHSVEKLFGDKSFYIVYTPTGTASVRGTHFDVAVEPQGASRFMVDTGAVYVSNDISDVYLHPGQTARVEDGEVIESPAYAFSLQGELTYQRGSTWMVSNIPFTVEENAWISAEPQVGEYIMVEGHLREDGSWIVDQVSPAQSQETQATFNHVLENIKSDSLQVGNWDLQVDKSTQLLEDVASGQPVRVSFTTANDGRWIAQQVAPLGDVDELETTSPTPTPDPEAQPSLSFEPDELGSAACQTVYAVSGTLWNTADEPDDYAANVLLDYQIIKGVEFVNSVSLEPNFWEIIQPGESQDFEVSVDLNDDWLSAPTGSEVKVRVFVAQETNRPGHHRTRLTVTLISTCDELETGTPSSTSTETATPTVTQTPTETTIPTITVTSTPSETPLPTPPGETDCTGAQPHPTGMKLAQRYGVPYEEIMYWFCQGFGFGEIDLAYTLQLKSGWPVADIFNLKSSGMGWGNIKKMLDPKPTKVPRDKDK